MTPHAELLATFGASVLFMSLVFPTESMVSPRQSL